MSQFPAVEKFLREGAAEIMVAGGAEAPLAPLSFGAFAIIRAMSTRNDDPGSASRPFDAARDGFVELAEAAAVTGRRVAVAEAQGPSGLEVECLPCRAADRVR